MWRYCILLGGAVLVFVLTLNEIQLQLRYGLELNKAIVVALVKSGKLALCGICGGLATIIWYRLNKRKREL